MINEKRLDEILQHRGIHLDITRTPVGASVNTKNDAESLELIRLARLGLWAEKHGIPTLQEYTDEAMFTQGHGLNFEDYAKEALSALPKGEK